MFVTTSITEDNRVAVGLKLEEHGEVPQESRMAILTPMEARAYASQIIQRAERAELRARNAKRVAE